MSRKSTHAKKTYFGITALIISTISALFLLASFEVSKLTISPVTFSFLNNVTLLISCVTAPAALILGVMGYRSQSDSKRLSLIAIFLISLPFLILFVQFVLFLVR